MAKFEQTWVRDQKIGEDFPVVWSNRVDDQSDYLFLASVGGNYFFADIGFGQGDACRPFYANCAKHRYLGMVLEKEMGEGVRIVRAQIGITAVGLENVKVHFAGKDPEEDGNRIKMLVSGINPELWNTRPRGYVCVEVAGEPFKLFPMIKRVVKVDRK